MFIHLMEELLRDGLKFSHEYMTVGCGYHNSIGRTQARKEKSIIANIGFLQFEILGGKIKQFKCFYDDITVNNKEEKQIIKFLFEEARLADLSYDHEQEITDKYRAKYRKVKAANNEEKNKQILKGLMK